VKPLVKIFVQTKPSLPLSGFARDSDPELDFVVCNRFIMSFAEN